MAAFQSNCPMKKKTKIRLGFLLVATVAAISDVILRELPNQVLAGLNQPAADRVAFAEISVAVSR